VFLSRGERRAPPLVVLTLLHSQSHTFGVPAGFALRCKILQVFAID